MRLTLSTFNLLVATVALLAYFVGESFADPTNVDQNSSCTAFDLEGHCTEPRQLDKGTYTVDEFDRFLSTFDRGNHFQAGNVPPMLVFFSSYDCVEKCDKMRENFFMANQLQFKLYPDQIVKFVEVRDHLDVVIKKFKQLDVVPRIVFMENGEVVQVKHFITSREKEYGILHFLHRMLQPVFTQIHSEDDLVEFLHPSTTVTRDYKKEDPVTFVLIEPESGSLRSRSAFQTAARKFRPNLFLAIVRWNQGDWRTVLGLSNEYDIRPPALIRYEYGFPTKVLLNGHGQYFGLDDAVSNALERNKLPSVQDIHQGNYADVLVNKAALAVVIILYSTADELATSRYKCIELARQHPGAFLYTTMNRTKFAPSLRALIEDDVRVFAYNKSEGKFWVKESGISEDQFVQDLLSGKVDTQYEYQLLALPRLLKKAVLVKPWFAAVVLVVILVPIFLIYVIIQVCCMPYTPPLAASQSVESTDIKRDVAISATAANATDSGNSTHEASCDTTQTSSTSSTATVDTPGSGKDSNDSTGDSRQVSSEELKAQ